MTWPDPIVLEGQHATLQPLKEEHHDALIEAATDGQLWELWYTSVPSPTQMKAEIKRRLDLQGIRLDVAIYRF